MPAFPPISEYLADSGVSIWASCGAERPCEHNAQLDELSEILMRRHIAAARRAREVQFPQTDQIVRNRKS